MTSRLTLAQIAALGFVIGVLLHACVVVAVLDDERPSSAEDPVRIIPGVAPLPTPTRPADRSSCDEIRGTDYRSESERQWFLQNCR